MMQFKTKLRRIFAAILSLCMLAGALPAQMPIFTAAAADNTSFNFTMNDTANNWSIHSKGSDADGFNAGGAYTLFRTATKGNWAAIKLDIDVTGEYYPILSSYKWHRGGTADIYFMPYTEGMDIASALVPANYSGTVSFKQTTEENGVKDTLKKVNLENTGEYLLVFKISNSSTVNANNNMHEIYPSALSFAEKGEILTESKSFNFTISDILVNWELDKKSAETDALSVAASYTLFRAADKGSWAAIKLEVGVTGEYYPQLSSYKWKQGGVADVYFMPYTENIAAGLVTENYVGEVSFRQSAETSGVKDLLKKVNIKNTGDYLIVFKIAESSEVNANNAKHEIYPTSLDLISEEDAIKPVDNFILTSKDTAGNWQVHGKQSTVDEDVNVIFGGAAQSAARNKWINVDNIRDAAVLFAKCQENYPFLYYNFDITTPLNYIPYDNRLDLVLAQKDAWFAFDVNVASDGEYLASINTYAEANTDDYSVYLVPESVVGETNREGNINAAIAGDEYLLGNVTGKITGSEAVGNHERALGTHSLAAGKYKVVLVSAGARKINNTYHKLSVTSFSLTKGGATGSKSAVFSAAPAYSLLRTEDKGTWGAIKLKVNTKGECKVELSSYKWKQGGAADVYFMPYTADMDIASALTSDNYIGTVSFRNATDVFDAKDTLKNVKIDDMGEYLLVFKIANSSVANANNAKHEIYPSGFKLTSITHASLKLGFSQADCATNDVTKAKNGGWEYYAHPESTWIDASFATDANGNINLTKDSTQFNMDSTSKWVAMSFDALVEGRYTLSGTQALRANGGRHELYILPLKSGMGEAEITASLIPEYMVGKMDSYGANPTADVRISDLSEYVDLTQTGKYLVVIKGTGTRAGRSSGNYALLSTLKMKRIGEVPKEFRAKTERTALIPGMSTKLSMGYYTGPVDKEEVTDITVTCTPATALSYDAENGELVALDVSEAVDVKVSVSAKYDGEPLSAELTIPVSPLGEEYKLYDFIDDKDSYPVTVSKDTVYPAKWAGYGHALADDEAYYYVSLDVGKKGFYNAELLYGRNIYSGIFRVHLIPDGQDVVAAMASEEYLLGEIDGFSTDVVEEEKKSFGSVYVSEGGTYKLVIQGTGRKVSASYGYNGYINKFVLDSGAVATAELSIDEDPLYLNGNYQTSLTAKTENGTVVGAEMLDVTYSSSSENAKIDEMGAVTAQAVGSAELTAQVAYGDKVSASLPINIIYPNSMLIEQAEISAKKRILAPGEQTDTVIQALAQDGSEISLTGAQITYKSSNEDIAAISQDGKITAKVGGSVEISAEISLNSVKKTVSTIVHVLSNEHTVEINSVSVSLGKDAVDVGSTGQATASAVVTVGGKEDVFSMEDIYLLDGVSVTFASGNSSVISVESNGSYQVIATGTANVSVAVSYKGATQGQEISVHVGEFAGETFEYDFKKATNPVWETSYANTYDTWEFAAYSPKWVPTIADIQKIGVGIQARLMPLGKWIAFKIKVPKAGAYGLELQHSRYYSGGDVDVFVLPGDTQDIDAALTASNRVGTVTYRYIDKVEQSSVVTPLDEKGTLFVEESGEEFIVVMKSTRYYTSDGGYTYTAALRLIGINEFNDLSFSLDKNVLELCDDPSRNSTALSFEAVMLDGTAVPEDKFKVSYRSSDDSIATVDKNGIVTAVGEGRAEISIIAIYNGTDMLRASQTVTVKDISTPLSAELVSPGKVYVRSKANIGVAVAMSSGNDVSILEAGDSVDYRVLGMEPEGAAEISEDGVVTGVTKGKVTVEATVHFRGKDFDTVPITFEILDSEKGKSTVWTDDKREALLYNAQHDASIRSRATSYALKADKRLENLDMFYDMVVAEGLPRWYFVGHKRDPKYTTCRYCGVDFQSERGLYGWNIDVVNAPWKIECPTCRRRFPTNDFGSYYKLGLDERGVFNPTLAKKTHDDLFGDKPNVGFLKNTLYPEKDKELGVEGWGVDNGFGYVYEYIDENAQYVKEQHTYIAYYLHEGLWHTQKDTIDQIIVDFQNAYLYTGEAKYGRAGAILLDRIADFFPDFDWYQWRSYRDDAYRGTVMDAVWTTSFVRRLISAYDAFYPVYEDPQLIDYLNKKSKQWDMNPKDSAAAIRKNVEDNFLKEVFNGAKTGDVSGNFGMAQAAVTSAAVVLNTMPETAEMLDWVMAPGVLVNTGPPADIKGGNTLAQLVDIIDRDGMGNEGSPEYNIGWVNGLISCADTLVGYELYPDIDLYKNPKFIKMIDAHLPVLMGGYYSAAIGDSGNFGGSSKSITTSLMTSAYQATNDIKYAQTMYFLNGNSAKGLRYGDTVKDPSSLEKEVENIVKKYGELDLGSTFQSGYGLYALRDGKRYTGTHNTIRDFWMYTGTSYGHGHLDGLNLGIDAFGFNMAPEHGYPKDTGGGANQVQWVAATISHNTVVVDEKSQKRSTHRGTPMHFDDAGKVKLMDADRSVVYEKTDIYRRTVVMVEVDDSVSYGVDFFRVRGGNDHLYSFHSQSGEIAETENLTLVPQSGITYAGKFAGKDVEFGPDPHPESGSGWNAQTMYPHGYTWLNNVVSDDAPAREFAIDLKLRDFRNVLKDKSPMNLRMTMLNPFDVEEVSVADGYPIYALDDPKNNIKYVLVRNKDAEAESLETLFTTVLEPYKGERYLKKLQTVPITYANGDPVPESEPVRAIKVTHTNNRVDYIVYSTDNTVEYTVDGMFNFKGFVTVVTYADFDGDGKVGAEDLAYTYLNDGEKTASVEDATVAYTGEVVTFTEKLSLDNRIDVTFENELTDKEVEALAGRYIYVDNDGVDNGGYKINAAKRLENGNIELDIGDITLIRKYVDSSKPEKGFVYNIERGQSFRIPLSYVSDTAPTMERTNGEYSATAGSRMSFSVSAQSDYGRQITYEAVNLPRGASFDKETATFSWTPDITQLGDHSVVVKASDGVLSTSYTASITVYKSVGGTDSSQSSGTESGNPGAGAGSGTGGGGAGGGGGSSSGNDTGNTETGGDNTGGDNTGAVGDGVLDVPNEKFVDLGNHTWAKDAIYALVEKGVVNGTSENTYSPANNIKRADFAIMLVRAFGIKSGEGANFADVDADKYYAEELRLAKANGIVNGIGNDKFNPEGDITRQDMMLMLTRALEAQGKALEEADESVLSQFVDAAEISDYARSAVASVVKAGIIAGSNGRINPLGRATRAEIAVMLERVFG